MPVIRSKHAMYVLLRRGKSKVSHLKSCFWSLPAAVAALIAELRWLTVGLYAPDTCRPCQRHHPRCPLTPAAKLPQLCDAT